MPIVPVGYTNMPQDWHVLDIKLFDGSGFQIYVGTPGYGKDGKYDKKSSSDSTSRFFGKTRPTLF